MFTEETKISGFEVFDNGSVRLTIQTLYYKDARFIGQESSQVIVDKSDTANAELVRVYLQMVQNYYTT